MVLFLYTVTGLFGQILPLKKVIVHKARRPTPWFNDTISEGIQTKNKAKQTFEKTGSNLDENIYRNLKNKLKASICQAKVDYLTSSIAESKSCPQVVSVVKFWKSWWLLNCLGI